MVMNSTSKKRIITTALRLLGFHPSNFYATISQLKQQQSQHLPLHLCEQQPHTGNVIIEEAKDRVIATSKCLNVLHMCTYLMNCIAIWIFVGYFID